MKEYKNLKRVQGNIKILRKAANISQETLAELVDLSRQTIADTENGKHSRVTTIVAIAAIFKNFADSDERMTIVCDVLGVDDLLKEVADVE